MAVVYAARDLRLDRRVAVKVMPVAGTEPAERHRFVREARSAAGLFHPNAVAVFDAGEADDHLYLVMELVAGRTLADLLAERGPFEPAQATAIIAPVLVALGHAHAAGIVHRDVKPSNIMVSDDGTVKLLDFGIARRFDDLAGAITTAGQMVGTPQYLAPEQIEGGPVSPATDLYAVGVVLFEMLTGSVPFNGDSAVATALARLHAPAPDVRSRRPDVPPDLALVVRQAMAREPAERFNDAGAMQAALLPSLQAARPTRDTAPTAVVAPPTVTLHPTQVLPASDRSRGRVLRLVAVVAALVLAAGLLTWYTASADSNESPPSTPTSSSAVTTVAPSSTVPPSTTPATSPPSDADDGGNGRGKGNGKGKDKDGGND